MSIVRIFVFVFALVFGSLVAGAFVGCAIFNDCKYIAPGKDGVK